LIATLGPDRDVLWRSWAAYLPLCSG